MFSLLNNQTYNCQKQILADDSLDILNDNLTISCNMCLCKNTDICMVCLRSEFLNIQKEPFYIISLGWKNLSINRTCVTQATN